MGLAAESRAKIFRSPATGDQLADTAKNQDKLIMLIGLLRQTVAGVAMRGFHGNVSLTFTVQDGTIQDMTTVVNQRHR